MSFFLTVQNLLLKSSLVIDASKCFYMRVSSTFIFQFNYFSDICNESSLRWNEIASLTTNQVPAESCDNYERETKCLA